MAFHLAKMNSLQLVTLELMVSIALNNESDMYVAYDADLQEFKFKVGQGGWSPPIDNVETRD